MHAAEGHTTGRLARGLALAIAVVLSAAGLTSCSPPQRVLVLGDSLTLEMKASPDAVHWATPSGSSIDWGGALFMSAPCNGLNYVKQLREPPDVVIINYSGNNGSFVQNCMGGETGAALVQRYLDDVAAIGRRFHDGRTKLAILGAPTRQPLRADSDAVFAGLQRWAGQHHVPFVDGGRYVTPDRVLARTAACLGRETGSRCGSAGPGRNYIRDAKLEHLCQGYVQVDGRCATYNSGAVRVAVQLNAAIVAARAPGG